ncbi:hypothetical protein B9Z55_003511 [Caenorhabditis nigoni]|uniref:Uncharacterized protein n=1 Tax=Caenorhabditis nigoni TaxID=1611254 RepID=A0A2G5VRD8_9PELO|nr:hypothetical protein B9Z55_003511 [Caenorhabditis nigoni]
MFLQLDRIPICFQHRCWCATPDSPLIAPMSYYTTTPEPETTEFVPEGSGDAEIAENAENPEQTPIKFDLLDYIKNLFLTGPDTENGF